MHIGEFFLYSGTALQKWSKENVVWQIEIQKEIVIDTDSQR